MQIEPSDIPAVSQLVDELCGVTLDQTKGYLIDSRLGPLLKTNNLGSYRELCTKARMNQRLKDQIVDAITTQETLFFRDGSPFQSLRDRILREIIDSKANTPYAKRLRIWSAACSTGQEPYSIAMVLLDVLPNIRSWDVSILATDISDSALQQASLGRYASHEVRRGMTPEMLARHFDEQPPYWRINERIRSLVRFDRRNLLKPFTELGPFDIIFCRNVAIYFQVDTKRDLFHRLADRLTPGGYLFTGASETLSNLDPRFMPQRHNQTVYYQPARRTNSALI